MDSQASALVISAAELRHRLRTPLNHILGFGQLLELAGLEEDALADVSKIRTAGNHLLALINDILDFSKMEAGKLPIEAADFNGLFVVGRPDREAN